MANTWILKKEQKNTSDVINSQNFPKMLSCFFWWFCFVAPSALLPSTRVIGTDCLFLKHTKPLWTLGFCTCYSFCLECLSCICCHQGSDLGDISGVPRVPNLRRHLLSMSCKCQPCIGTDRPARECLPNIRGSSHLICLTLVLALFSMAHFNSSERFALTSLPKKLLANALFRDALSHTIFLFLAAPITICKYWVSLHTYYLSHS